jgi:hypothetical protein
LEDVEGLIRQAPQDIQSILAGIEMSFKTYCEKIADLQAEKRELELKYRERLWRNHGCRFSSLYGDDGEMQCNECGLDFKSGSTIDELEKTLAARAFARYEEDKARLADCGNIPDLDKDIDVYERLTTMGMALDVEKHEHAKTKMERDGFMELAKGATACVETGQKWMESDGKKIETLRTTVNVLGDLLLRIHPHAKHRLKCVEEDCEGFGSTSQANEASNLIAELDQVIEAIKKGRAG